jgi:hypothetical protein
MLTKLLSAVVLTGALWVAGDAAYQKFDCCTQGSDCCNPPRECCVLATKQKASDCCSRGSDCCNPSRECCLAAKSSSKAQTTSCCQSTYVYCTLTDEIYEGCCCEIVNGRHRCLVTGTVSDVCCCIPLND